MGDQGKFGFPDRAPAQPVLLQIPDWPDWYRPTKYRKTANNHVRNGHHPFGRKLGPDGSTCGSCRHRFKNHRGFSKCDQLPRQTRGPGTDVVGRWRGCDLWAE